MNFYDYYETIKGTVIPETLEFDSAVMCLHRSRLPLRLASLGGCNSIVIRVPQFARNSYGSIVPVTKIKAGAFSNNKNVTDILLPSNISEIPKGAFTGCKNLKNITLPKSIKRIEEKTFEGCTSLENVYYEGTREEWNQIDIVCEKYEIDFGDVIPGSPVQEILDERKVFIPGNEALRTATIHFNCDFRYTIDCSSVLTGIGDDEEVKYIVDRGECE